MKRKYNPNFHQGIVQNIRLEAKEADIPTDKFTDEDVYNIFCYWYGVEGDEVEVRLNDLRSGTKRDLP